MKSWLSGVVLLIGLNLYAAGTNTPPATPLSGNGALSHETPKRGTAAMTFILRKPKPNEIIGGKLIFDGIAIELFKTRRPLQLLNPFAPDLYGSPEDNEVRDPINGRPSGLKLFAIRF